MPEIKDKLTSEIKRLLDENVVDVVIGFKKEESPCDLNRRSSERRMNLQIWNITVFAKTTSPTI